MSVPVLFGSIALNEEWLVGDCLEQHAALCDHWFIAEGADRLFEKKTEQGLSVDSTVERFLDWRRKHASDGLAERVTWSHYGHAANKMELRNGYADAINRYLEERAMARAIVVVIDIDEFLCRPDLVKLVEYMRGVVEDHPSIYGAVRIPHVHFWRDAGTIIGGKYYNVAHDRLYWWPRGARYEENHNHPARDGRLLQQGYYEKHDPKLVDLGAGRGLTTNVAAWYHLGFCKDDGDVDAKNRYYVARGEAKSRPETTESRAAFFTERESGKLPAGIEKKPWVGPWPEIISEHAEKYGIAGSPLLGVRRTELSKLW
jgi:hypothetical protein